VPKKVSENEVSPPSRFMFSTTAAEDSEKDLELRINALEQRLATLDERCALMTHHGHPMPVLRQILAIGKDPEDITRLAKGLERAAQLDTELEELTRRLEIINAVKKEPNWFASVFADFADDVEKFTGPDSETMGNNTDG
jgi:hypothetical protein